MDYLPLIIIGAPRSGTNMLRDVVCRLPRVGTWPCDEINFVWRYGNPAWPNDELPPALATERVSAYIAARFSRLATKEDLDVVVEKTCANSLRVPYVDAVVPAARYVWIYREPMDCVASALKRWTAPLDLPYTLKKSRYVPLRDWPYYGTRFIRNRLFRMTSGRGRVASWGPVFDGMEAALETRSLVDVCTLQWRACIENSAQAFAAMPVEKWIPVSYERFVDSPREQLARICEFLGLSTTPAALESAVADVSAGSIGKGRKQLGGEESDVAELAAPGLAALRDVAMPREQQG